jgi:hypothetical protein
MTNLWPLKRRLYEEAGTREHGLQAFNSLDGTTLELACLRTPCHGFSMTGAEEEFPAMIQEFIKHYDESH